MQIRSMIDYYSHRITRMMINNIFKFFITLFSEINSENTDLFFNKFQDTFAVFSNNFYEVKPIGEINIQSL